ncbi:dTDP-4-dehydrorhamnose reductase [Microcella putealis]|uniref:dTDP-4-dehydrorhamnose reductase n=1 Tax=Microcella putealis TaxID=337005 RepID=A0A4Q7LSW2_9MICO|nr:dTDP-4-dehydrorhamnose reductase [Microcella putealis]RZS57397.1 dTDP-4-dehydrorhamnose reductase [Microcella putealis]TQM19460.1 dTDP-4-dehydrorhamnose reductase [Microcella putealis]
MTRILIAGASGMLGRDLQTALAGRAVTAATRAELDITDAASASDAVAGHDVVVNCAAYTAVDAAESDEEAAHLINATGAENLARASARHGARLIQVSTDYVFAGDATSPYAEDARLAPVSAYGRTKADGERLARAAHPDGTIIVRTAWLYGQHGPNFAATMLKLAADRETLTVVDDQRGQPTWTADLAAHLVALIDSPVTHGVFHGTASGETTWFGFARAIFENAGLDPERVQPTDSSSFVRPAPRPAYSVLGHDAWAAAGLATPRDWRTALDAAFTAGAVATP